LIFTELSPVVLKFWQAIIMAEQKSPADAKFTAPQQTEEDLSKSQIVGLAETSDFRKRKAEGFRQLAKLPGGTSTASAAQDG
jgi:hypothetical protein